MNEFIRFCNQLSTLDKVASDELFDKLKTKTFQKGDYLLNDGDVCRYLYFIDKGLTKTFFYRDKTGRLLAECF